MEERELTLQEQFNGLMIDNVGLHMELKQKDKEIERLKFLLENADCERLGRKESQMPTEKINETWTAELTEADTEIWHEDIEANNREEVIEEGIK